MPSRDILYVGFGLAGCSTSVAAIAKSCTPQPTPLELRSAPCAIRWSHAGEAHELRLLHEYYSMHYVPNLRAAIAATDEQRMHLRPGWREVSRFLATASGIIFVADSQRFRLVAGEERIEFLDATLREHGRDPSQIPLVFQLNKRDRVEHRQRGRVVELGELFVGHDSFAASASSASSSNDMCWLFASSASVNRRRASCGSAPRARRSSGPSRRPISGWL
jgi:hypothetical protein